jgi:hypothetical protein
LVSRIGVAPRQNGSGVSESTEVMVDLLTMWWDLFGELEKPDKIGDWRWDGEPILKRESLIRHEILQLYTDNIT